MAGWGRSRAGYQEAGHVCDWFGERICLSLVGPELEVRAKVREAMVTDQVLTFGSQLPQKCGLPSRAD